MTRRGWLKLAATGAVISYPAYFEPRWFEVTEKRVPIAALERRVRVLHLSDLHYGFRVPLSLLHRAVDLGLERKPDVICLTGDYVTNNWTDHPLLMLDVLSRLAKAAPTFGVLGNHDIDPVGEVLLNAGVRLLDNAAETLTIAGQRLGIIGLGDLWSTGVMVGAAFEKAPAGVPRLVLCHNPDTKDYVRDVPFDLMMSGHTHGGQVVLPILGPRARSVRDQSMIAGLFRWNGRWIHVTRGVGSLWGVRLNCRPEVSILDLVPA